MATSTQLIEEAEMLVGFVQATDSDTNARKAVALSLIAIAKLLEAQAITAAYDREA